MQKDFAPSNKVHVIRFTAKIGAEDVPSLVACVYFLALHCVWEVMAVLQAM